MKRMNRRIGTKWIAAGCAGLLLTSAPLVARPASSSAGRTAAPADSRIGPAQQRALALLEALKSPDANVVKDFLAHNLPPEALKEKKEQQWISSLLAETIKLRGGSFVRWEKVGDTEAQLVYRNDLFDRLETTGVTVEPAAPHRITGWSKPKPLPSNTPAPRNDEELAARLDAFARRMEKHDFFSGTILIERGDTLVLAKAYGLAERNMRAPNHLDTKMKLASITKLFTAVAIGQLVEQGKVSLDDPITKYVPDVAGGDRVRIRHLLSHTSALGDIDYGKAWEMSPFDLRTLDDWIKVSDMRPPAREPGTSWEYSNLGYTYLGKVIEAASGQDYYSYLTDHVFKPAGMVNSGVWGVDYVIPNLAHTYEMEFDLGAGQYRNVTLRDGARGPSSGGAISTVEDLARFARALRTGVLLKPATFRQFTTPLPETGKKLWGLGFYNAKLGNSEIMGVGHGGNLMGTCTEFLMFEHQGTPWTITVLSNSGLRACYPMFGEMETLLGQMLTSAGK